MRNTCDFMDLMECFFSHEYRAIYFLYEKRTIFVWNSYDFHVNFMRIYFSHENRTIFMWNSHDNFHAKFGSPHFVRITHEDFARISHDFRMNFMPGIFACVVNWDIRLVNSDLRLINCDLWSLNWDLRILNWDLRLLNWDLRLLN